MKLSAESQFQWPASKGLAGNCGEEEENRGDEWNRNRVYCTSRGSEWQRTRLLITFLFECSQMLSLLRPTSHLKGITQRIAETWSYCSPSPCTINSATCQTPQVRRYTSLGCSFAYASGHSTSFQAPYSSYLELSYVAAMCFKPHLSIFCLAFDCVVFF
jgi:hypothetical protein